MVVGIEPCGDKAFLLFTLKECLRWSDTDRALLAGKGRVQVRMTVLTGRRKKEDVRFCWLDGIEEVTVESLGDLGRGFECQECQSCLGIRGPVQEGVSH
jgi:hypothetical protein